MIGSIDAGAYGVNDTRPVRGVLLDLNGVLYVGDSAPPAAVEWILILGAR
jgi:ribonucleotide monophosphatase NagD (HAD superfamily)